MKSLDDIRNLFLEVKLEVFGTSVKNNKRFPKVIQELNSKALNYFEMVKTKKNANFKDWGFFHKLYKHESFSYYILNFIIINLPCIGRPLFALKNLIKRKSS